MIIPASLPIRTAGIHSPQITIQLRRSIRLPIPIITAINDNITIGIPKLLGEALTVAKVVGQALKRNAVVGLGEPVAATALGTNTTTLGKFGAGDERVGALVLGGEGPVLVAAFVGLDLVAVGVGGYDGQAILGGSFLGRTILVTALVLFDLIAIFVDGDDC